LTRAISAGMDSPIHQRLHFKGRELHLVRVRDSFASEQPTREVRHSFLLCTVASSDGLQAVVFLRTKPPQNWHAAAMEVAYTAWKNEVMQMV
jgi:hypothetical protein